MTKKEIQNLRGVDKFLHETDFSSINDPVLYARLSLVCNWVHNCWVADKLHNIYDDISLL